MGGSTGIVYGGLKYQVILRNICLFSFSPNPKPQISNLLFRFPYFQARCIADVSADPDNTSFLAGTLSLREENEVFFFFSFFWSLWFFFFYLFEIEIVVRILFGWSFCRCILSGCRRRGRSLFARVCSTIRVRSGISSHAHLIQGSSPLASLLVGYSLCNSWWGLVIFHVYKKFNLAVVFLVCSLDRVSAEFKCEFR